MARPGSASAPGRGQASRWTGLTNVFACLVLERSELQLEDHQPEEQHGFRRGKRIEEHLLTANAFLDKTLAVGIPVRVVSLDLSKAFDRVHWPAL